MFVSFTLMLSVQCGACKMAMPVNGVVSAITCYHCGEHHELEIALWKRALEPRRLAAAMGFAEGEGKPVQAFGSPQFSLTYGKRTPRCQSCKGPDLAIEDLIAAVPSGHTNCPRCGLEIRARDADAFCKEIEPHARIVVHESALDPAARALETRSKPVLFACMGCGAGLPADGTSRSVTCTYCQAANYLPDGLWQQLRPVPKSHVWFFVCEYDEAAARRASLADEDARRNIAGSRDATSEDLATLAADSDVEIRERVGANPRTAPATLTALATDESVAVQVAVATNQRTPADALRTLAEAGESRVCKVLLRRADLPPELVELLAKHSNEDVRVSAAPHPNLALESLHRLKRDEDDRVSAAAKERLADLRAQGVDVDAGRGWFQRLFG